MLFSSDRGGIESFTLTHRLIHGHRLGDNYQQLLMRYGLERGELTMPLSLMGVPHEPLSGQGESCLAVHAQLDMAYSAPPPM